MSRQAAAEPVPSLPSRTLVLLLPLAGLAAGGMDVGDRFAWR